MIKRLSLKTKIFSLVLFITFADIVVEILLTYSKQSEIVNSKYEEELHLVSDVEVHNINASFDHIQTALKALVPSGQLLYSGDPSVLNFELEHYITDLPIENIYLTDENLSIGKSIHPTTESLKQFVAPQLYAMRNGSVVTQIIKSHKGHFVFVSEPILLDKKVVGFIIAKVDVKKLLQLSIDNMINFGESGKIKIVRRINNTKIEVLYNSDYKDSTATVETLSTERPFTLASTGNTGFKIAKSGSLKNQECLYFWEPVDVLNAGIIVSLDREEAYKILNSLYIILVIKWIGGVLIALSLGFIFFKLIRVYIDSVRDSVRRLSLGIVPEKLDTGSGDTIGKLSMDVNNMANRIKELANYTLNIGNQDKKTEELKALDEKDVLAHALIGLNNRIEDVNNQDAVNNWVVSGVAELSSILRSENNISELGDALTEYITNKIEGRQTSIYLFYENRLPQIELLSAYAYGKKKFEEKYLKVGQGLVGKTAFERKESLFTEFPKDYDYIKSGLKDTPPPQSALFYPLLSNNMLIGVLECNADKTFSKRELAFIEEISEIIAQTLYSVQLNKKTENLLEDVSNAQNKLQALLENASEVIAITDTMGYFSYLSPNIQKILGYGVEDLIDEEITEYILEEDQGKIENLFVDLLNKPTEILTVQMRFVKENKTPVWVEVSARNFLEDPAIKGIVLNLTDITVRKKAEEEEKKRGQMQALSENSLDIITRISTDEVFFYLNPTISRFSGLKSYNFVNKTVDQCELDDTIKTAYKDILDAVLRSRRNAHSEHEILDYEGNQLFFLFTGIPEFNDDMEIESVLVVAHDITDRKRIEQEIQLKNKKIEESINYAKSIQGTIIPSAEIIQDHLPNSFMIFKPKDVVSGDFPWLHVEDDIIYLAGVDCTGHGVPGAMISFVGYFLLNHAIKASKLTQAGEIMDELDMLVTEAFRQNSEDSKIKDGMDMGLCRIDLKNKKLQYAGAHRPVYVIRNNGELEEYKGDKFPVGGGSAFRNKTNFTCTELTMNEGDTIFFFSDGFPDQFGGPKNRKFGPKNIKEIVVDTAGKPLDVIHKALDSSLTEWQGEYPQTDDILLFGIRF